MDFKTFFTRLVFMSPKMFVDKQSMNFAPEICLERKWNFVRSETTFYLYSILNGDAVLFIIYDYLVTNLDFYGREITEEEQ